MVDVIGAGFGPHAKVIRTVRDPERWYDSAYNTIYQFAAEAAVTRRKTTWSRACSGCDRWSRS